MILCLVTDRLRLAGADAPLDRARGCLEDQMRFAIDAGIDIVQVRERDLAAAVLASLVRDLLALARGTGTRVVVNDRLDVALATGAGGVHLRADSMATGQARRIAPPGFLVGRSVHSVTEALAAGDADYLIAGTVFPSQSKGRSADVIGAEGLRAIAASTDVPVLGIGGIAAPHVPQVAAAGAAGLAAIGLFMAAGANAGEDACGAVPLRAVVSDVRRLFDTAKTHP